MKGNLAVLDNEGKWPTKFGKHNVDPTKISGSLEDNEYNDYCDQKDYNQMKEAVPIGTSAVANSTRSSTGGAIYKNKTKKNKRITTK